MESLIVPNELFFEHLLQEIEAHRKVMIPTKGNSMLPLIRPQSDRIELSALNEGSVKKGNIVLARTRTGLYVVHRIEKVEEGVITLRGDGNPKVREECDREHVVAEVTAVYRKGRRVGKGSLEWRLAEKWWFSSPLMRRIFLGIYRRII